MSAANKLKPKTIFCKGKTRKLKLAEHISQYNEDNDVEITQRINI